MPTPDFISDTTPITQSPDAAIVAGRALLSKLWPLAQAVLEGEESLDLTPEGDAALHKLVWAIVDPVTRWANDFETTDIYGDEEKAVHAALQNLSAACGWRPPK